MDAEEKAYMEWLESTMVGFEPEESEPDFDGTGFTCTICDSPSHLNCEEGW